jgi:WD40 repeat protein
LPTGQSLLRLSTGPNLRFDAVGCRWASEINSVHHVQHLIDVREFRTLSGHTRGKGPSHACFHPDQPLLVSSSLDGVRIWDLVAGREAGFLPGKFVTSHFSPDGSQLLACGASGVFCWPVQMDEAAQTLRIGPSRRLADASKERWGYLSPDGRWLAATDRARDTVDLFEMPSGRKRIPAFDGIASIALAVPSPDGRWCLGGSWPENELGIWDTQSGELRKIDVDGPPKAAFNPAGTRLVVSGRHHGRIYAVPGWNLEAELPEHPTGGFGQPCYSPDGRILALTRNGYVIQLLDATTLEELATLEVTQPMNAGQLAFSPDGARLAAVFGVNAVVLWDLRLVRERLAAMNLDWPHPAFPPPRSIGDVCPRIVIEPAAPDLPRRRSILPLFR